MSLQFLGRRFAHTLFCVLVVCTTPSIVNAEDEDDVKEIDGHVWICALDLDTNTSRRLFTVPQLASAGSVSMSPDGKQVAFDGALPGSKLSPGSHIFVCNIDGTEMKDLGPGAMPSWSPRSKRIAFSRYSPENGAWTMNADGTDKQLLDKSGWCAQWSPDGLKIAYTRQIAGAADFVIFNIVEDESTAVFGDGTSGYRGFYWNFAWSPDSQRICFKGTTSERPQQVASVTIAPEPQVQIHYQYDSITPDFTWLNNETIVTLMWSSEFKCRQLSSISILDGKESSPVLIPGQFPGRQNTDADLSRDGKLLLYVSHPHPSGKTSK